MPKPPGTSRHLDDVGVSVFSSLAHRLATFTGEVYPLHVGDTWLEPAEGARMEDLKTAEHPGLHRYAPPQGLPELLEALAERVGARTGVAAGPGEVLMGAGATGALAAGLGAVVEPGDEVILLAPYWPLIPGMVRCAGGVPVAAPVDEVLEDPASLAGALDPFRTQRTVAAYLNTPNNPTGRVMSRPFLEAVADYARRHDLWLFSDEVYEDYVYRGEHVSLRSLAPERTFAVYSFSKAYGMAGNRCGYVVGPKKVMTTLRKVSTHAFYSTPTASQVAAMKILDGRGEAWLRRTRAAYERTGRQAAERLGLPAPEGSTFLFLDVADRLDARGLLGFLEDCAGRGLFLAPGPSFGPYPSRVRLCFTSAPPDAVLRGVEILAERLGR